MSSKDYIYCYQGSALRVGSGNVVVGKVFDPYDPSTIEPFTIRCRFSPGYTPTMGDRQTLVVESENIWDITRNSTDWGTVFFRYNTSLLEVLGANSYGVTKMGNESSDLGGMFTRCTSLSSVALFDTSSVTNMGCMFSGCSLTSVPLFDTSHVTCMKSMFYNNQSLTTVPLFDTSSCTDMSYTFSKCSSLTTVPLFDTSSCTTIKQIFSWCSSLTTVPLFDTSSASDMDFIFPYCSSLRYIPLFDTSSCTTIREAFLDCTNVESGILALYQQLSSKESVPAHSSCFRNCGTNTTTGSAELAQIPSDWK